MTASIEEIILQINSSDDFIHKAKLILHLRREKGLMVKEIAEKLAFKSAYICHILRLNKLPENIIDGYYSKTILISHLFILSRLKNFETIVQAYEEVLKNNLTAGQTEELVRELVYGVKNKGNYINKEKINKLTVEIVGDKKNVSIKVGQSRIKSKITIEIKGNLSQTSLTLNKILEKLKGW